MPKRGGQQLNASFLLQYSAWANLSDWSDFYWEPATTEMFRQHIRAMTHRVNSVNGENASLRGPPVLRADQSGSHDSV